MPAPSNYLTVDAFPYSRVITQAEFNGGTFGNSSNEVWFRLDITSAREVLGFYITIGGTFTPRWLLYGENGDTDPALFDVSSASNPSWYYAFSNTEANPYYLRVIKRPVGGTPSDFDFTFNADNRPLAIEPVTAGSIIVNDDTGTDLPSAVIDPETGEVLSYIDIPASEHGALLVSGESAWYDRFGRLGAAGTFAIFDKNYEYVVSTSQVFSDPPSVTASEDEIFALESGSGEVYRINIDGSTDLVATLAHPNTTSIGVDVDGAILYYVDASGYTVGLASSDNVIHAWDLDTDTALPDLYTEPDLDTDDGGLAVTFNIWPGEILVLPDGSVVTWAHNADALHDILLHIDSDGTLLNSYTYDWAERQINHIAYVNNGSEEIAVWFYDFTGQIATITTLTLEDGSESDPLEIEMFSNGQNLTGNTDTPFGMSSSCTFIIAGARSGTIPTDNSVQCPCPCPCPEEPKKVTPGITGLILPPIEETWDRNCEGGGVVPTAADATDPESWAV